MGWGARAPPDLLGDFTPESNNVNWKYALEEDSFYKYTLKTTAKRTYSRNVAVFGCITREKVLQE